MMRLKEIQEFAKKVGVDYRGKRKLDLLNDVLDQIENLASGKNVKWAKENKELFEFYNANVDDLIIERDTKERDGK